MKLFGHYITRVTALFAALDAILFLVLLQTLGVLHVCERCYLGSLLHLRLYQAFLITAVFLLITTSVGLYNTDATQDFRTLVITSGSPSERPSRAAATPSG